MATAQRRLQTARRTKRLIASHLNALKTDSVSLVEILQEPPDALKRVSIHTVMCAARHLGPQGVKKTLQAAHVWPEDRLGALTSKQREAIIKHLPPRARYGKS